MQAKTFAETDLFTWNVFAPRIGVVYDLGGDGRTVLKGNYGLYWHNPGVGVGGNGNPNIANKSAPPTPGTTSTAIAAGSPVKRARCRRRRSKARSRVDPNIKAPYTHEVSAWIERQLTDTMGVRAGFVYKTEDDLIEQYQPGRGVAPFAERSPCRSRSSTSASTACAAPATIARSPSSACRNARRRTSRSTQW